MLVLWRRQISTEKEIKYDKYKFSYKEHFIYLILIAIISSIFAMIFYNNILVGIIFMLPLKYYIKVIKKYMIRKRKDMLTTQFKDFCMSIVAQLTAGYSLENSILESYREMCQLYGKDSYISKEIKIILYKLKLNITIEKCFENLADRSDIEDIILFSEVISIAKRNGGDLISIVKDAANSIYRKIEVDREIKTIINSKKYEQIIMNIIPLLIVLYVRITCPGMLDVMYTTITGNVIMTGCLMMYIFAFCIGIKISDIRV